jgi:hypothetical protein
MSRVLNLRPLGSDIMKDCCTIIEQKIQIKRKRLGSVFIFNSLHCLQKPVLVLSVGWF